MHPSSRLSMFDMQIAIFIYLFIRPTSRIYRQSVVYRVLHKVATDSWGFLIFDELFYNNIWIGS